MFGSPAQKSAIREARKSTLDKLKGVGIGGKEVRHVDTSPARLRHDIWPTTPIVSARSQVSDGAGSADPDQTNMYKGPSVAGLCL